MIVIAVKLTYFSPANDVTADHEQQRFHFGKLALISMESVKWLVTAACVKQAVYVEPHFTEYLSLFKEQVLYDTHFGLEKTHQMSYLYQDSLSVYGL